VAWDVATEQGLAALSMGEVARRVGIRQPSMYAYVDSKMDLYDAMFAQAARALMDKVTAVSFASDPRQAVRQLIESLYEFTALDPVASQLLFLRTIPGFEPTAESYAVAVEFFVLTRDKLTAAGVTDPADVDIYTALFGGLIRQQETNEPGGDRWTRHLDTVLGMFFRYIDDKAATGGAGKRPATRPTTTKNPPASRGRPAPTGTSRRPPTAPPSPPGGPR